MGKFEDHVFELLQNEDFIQWVTAPSDESNHYWSGWIAADEQRKNYVNAARGIISSSGRKVRKMPEDDYQMILQNLVEYHNRNKSNNRRYLELWKPLGIAASILLVIFLSIFAVDRFKDEPLADSEPTFYSKSTLPGQKLTVKLDDGTLVKLNSGSKLTMPEKFDGKTREVQLSGEAFFEVFRDESKPFIITIEGLEVTVLGTSFSIKHDTFSNTKVVAVKSGKVRVKNQYGKSIDLTKHEMSVIDEQNEVQKSKIINEETVFGWTDNTLVFDEDQFDRVIYDLSRWFGVHFDIQTPVDKKIKFTASYKNPTLEEVLLSLSHVYNFKYEKYEKNVILK